MPKIFSEDELHNHDGEHFRLNDKVMITSKYAVSDYIHGRCHIFAQALKSVLGDKSTFSYILDNHGLGEDQPTLSHAYIANRNDQRLFDVRGSIDEGDLSDYEGQCIDFDHCELDTTSDIELLLSWGKPDTGEIQQIKSFINENIFIYTMTPEDVDDYSSRMTWMAKAMIVDMIF
jgi:hypothetical protein